MGVFSTNQARQFYVMSGAVKTSAPANEGEVQLVKTDPNAPYLIVKGKGGVTRTDLLTNIECVKVTDAGALATPIKQVAAKVVLPTSYKTDFKGKDVVLKIVVKQFAGISDEETYNIYGSARINGSSTATTIATELEENLKASLKKMVSPLFEVTRATDTITIKEVEQEWRLGVKPLVPVYFDVYFVPVDDTVTPTYDKSTKVTTYDIGITTPSTNGAIANGKAIADLEYFCMGERADIYRGVNWPHNIETAYMVDPSTAYAVLDIHYSYVGSNEGVQKSEKDLTVVTPTANLANLKALAKDIAATAGFANYKYVNATGVCVDESTASA